MIRVLLADDHAMVRAGLRLFLEREPDVAVAAEAADGRQAIQLAALHRPDVAVLDIGMPGLNGIEAATQIAAMKTAPAVVMLSMHSDESYVLRCLHAGAKGFLLKESAEADLITGIRAVHAGRSYFSERVRKMLREDHVRQLRQQGLTDSLGRLTAREREILQLIDEGKSNKEVAALLNLSLYTVETHRGNILEKLDLHSTAEIVLFAVRRGIVF